MIWAFINFPRPRALAQVEGIIDTEQDINILGKNWWHTREAACLLGNMPPVEHVNF